MREKAEKRALEERISVLQSQIVTGGGLGNVRDSPAFRNAVKEHQERVRQEYEARLADLEKVRRWFVCCCGGCVPSVSSELPSSPTTPHRNAKASWRRRRRWTGTSSCC